MRARVPKIKIAPRSSSSRAAYLSCVVDCSPIYVPPSSLNTLRPIFEGKNDLVVDTLSVTQFAAGSVFPAGNLHDFATNAEAHHCNHFESDKTLDFISESLRF
ncbi:MAG: hypothetical protein QOI59_98 [Gammaproteobacteria bacterium]|jgi:hypothetical protein|nr:hypothetical protein [Gammaproteobacteria bacterium]